ncbi:hypothetical protein [Psychrobacillus sp. MER TA 171]|uniref:hypothetical protein n=1 Tax=Psychrobacillus sp. MER TA 171 TaxID=2939577 RepID=UPI0020424123|nr:hypothetical protein [Psychrobacillus sp. MER TA 171]MCM3358151.1 hypothetical protein [Psychrobacillus sp. MER TA 171]
MKEPNCCYTDEILYLELIKEFRPKIKKSLQNTPVQEREDLEQEIMIKIYEKMNFIQSLKAPNFFEFIEENNYKNTEND